MDAIKVIYDPVGETLTVWFDDPRKEHECEEAAGEVVLMKEASGRVIGFELLSYHPTVPGKLSVQTVVLGQAG
jgi:uncharacterized protein YuzE